MSFSAVKLNNLSKKLARLAFGDPHNLSLGRNLSWCLKPKLDKAALIRIRSDRLIYMIDASVDAYILDSAVAYPAPVN